MLAYQASSSESSGDSSSSSGSGSSSSVSDSDSEGQLDERPRPPPRSRPQWRRIWSSSDGCNVAFSVFTDSLPSYTTRKNDPYKCTMDHSSLGDFSAIPKDHRMRTIITKCASTRCSQTRVECACRYKINTCQAREDSHLIVVYQEGEHTAHLDGVASPREAKMTPEMKGYVDEMLTGLLKPSNEFLFTAISAKVQEGTFQGPAPSKEKVRGYVKRWRKKNRDDSMQPVIDICARSMVEVVENVATTGEELLVFCDFKYENGIAVPDIGDASDDFPFRIGLTSYSLMKAYVEVQEDPRCTTLLHVDSTHNMVFQRYSVFILGISDSCGHFFPIVYYCASQRRAEDVAWCIAYLKRVMLSTFAVGFTPRFVMTDADDAQYNACASEVPTANILMCWFHVCQNAWQKARKLPKLQRDLVFRALNDLHFCVGETEFETKKAAILKQWKATSSSDRRFRSVSRAISKQWLLHPRFSRWQAYHTPSGYATTNNPVEQYHRTVKLVISSSDATPIEMVTFLNQSRIGFIAEKTAFSSITKVSKRLKAHYNKIKKQGELKATILPAVGDLRLQLVRVCHTPRLRTPVAPTHTDHAEGCTRRRDTQTSANSGKKKKKKKKKTGYHADDVGKPIKSAHTLRMQWDGMPVGGWIVDPTTRSCQCHFHIKYRMCPHVIEATKVVGMPCPGLPDPVRRFQSRDKRAKRKHAVSRGCVESAQLADEICDCRSASQGAVGASQGASTQHPSIAALSADTSSSDSLYPPRTLQHLQQYDAPPPTNNPAIPLHVYCPAVPLLDIVADGSADRRTIVQRRMVAEAEDRSPVLHFPEAYCVSYPSVSTSLNSLPATVRESCDQTKRRRR